jgi:hypothetical protein
MATVPPPGKRVIFVASVRTRKGKRIYAHHYGLKAFRILVDV